MIDHTKYMKIALKEALKGRGKVSPNPLVGAVIVKNGKIIGKGAHLKFGEEHAEINAFNNCSESPAGADLYVTLEPCDHHGKTPPCTERIIKEKVSRVFIATLDPFKKVNGNGAERLRKAGIIVEVGLLEIDAKMTQNGYQVKKVESTYINLEMTTMQFSLVKTLY
jgi:diaminohydroxyphosphoribosylaminopyrimidine deaminase/5-amino-6-(5-phosphoribosylamino)uracil reductase